MSWLIDLAMWCTSCVDQANAAPEAVGIAAGGAAATAAAAAAANSPWMDAGAGPHMDNAGPMAQPDYYPGMDGSKIVDSPADGTTRTYYPAHPPRVDINGAPVPASQAWEQIDLGNGQIINSYADGGIVGTVNGKLAWEFGDGQVRVADPGTGELGPPQRGYPVYDPNTGKLIDVRITPPAVGQQPWSPWPAPPLRPLPYQPGNPNSGFPT